MCTVPGHVLHSLVINSSPAIDKKHQQLIQSTFSNHSESPWHTPGVNEHLYDQGFEAEHQKPPLHFARTRELVRTRPSLVLCCFGVAVVREWLLADAQAACSCQLGEYAACANVVVMLLVSGQVSHPFSCFDLIFVVFYCFFCLMVRG